MLAQVLIVDDSLVARRLAEVVLQKGGCHVTTAGDGETAVHLCRSRKFDLVLLDCQMPVMDGFETLEGIRRTQNFGTPVVAWTASESQDACGRMDGYLSKPSRPADLRDCVARYVGRQCGA